MTGLLSVEDARRLHAAVDVLPVKAAREPFFRLLEVLEKSPGAAVLPVDELLSTPVDEVIRTR